jgi:hypothetical protein
MINNPSSQHYAINPMVSSSSRLHRPSYFVGYNPMPEYDSDDYDQVI